MLVYRNTYFQLEYDPVRDVLYVTLPDMRTAGLSEARQCFDLMIDAVRNYQVRNILLDSSKAVVEVDDVLYHQLIYDVSIRLKATGLQRVARVVSNQPKLEQNAVMVQGEVLESSQPVYKIQNFSNKQQALTWLTSGVTANFNTGIA